MAKSDARVDIERIALNVEEAAAALGIDPVRMGGLVRVGRVPHLQLGQRVLIGKRALEDWLTSECMAGLSAVGASELAHLPIRRTNKKTAER